MKEIEKAANRADEILSQVESLVKKHRAAIGMDHDELVKMTLELLQSEIYNDNCYDDDYEEEDDDYDGWVEADRREDDEDNDWDNIPQAEDDEDEDEEDEEEDDGFENEAERKFASLKSEHNVSTSKQGYIRLPREAVDALVEHCGEHGFCYVKKDYAAGELRLTPYSQGPESTCISMSTLRQSPKVGAVKLFGKDVACLTCEVYEDGEVLIY